MPASVQRAQLRLQDVRGGVELRARRLARVQERVCLAPDAARGDDGHPVLRTVTQCATGAAYTFLASGDGISIAGFEVPSSVPFGIAGTASALSNDGVIGFALPTDQVVALIEASLDTGGLNASIIAAIRNLSDIDTDGDRIPDALSFALAFEAAPCLLTTEE